MKLTRQQRINNIGSEIVSNIINMATECRKLINDGIDLKEGNPKGYPALKATGQEIRDALGENAKGVETIIDFAIDGKSNKVTKKKR